MKDEITIVPAPEAPAGRSDPTRRWALAFPDGAVRFPGVARTEAARAAPGLAGLEPAALERALVEVALPVVVSEGAGPYLLDAGGRLTLALGSHPRVAEAAVAMSEPLPGYRLGLVRRRAGEGVWTWLAMAEVSEEERVQALDDLDEQGAEEALGDWERRWRQSAGRAV